METSDSELVFEFSGGLTTQKASGEYKWEHEWYNKKVDIVLFLTLEFDGYQRYTINLNIKEPLKLDDFSLNIPFDTEVASHMMGMGLPGCVTPDSYTGKWLKPQDSFWMGNSEGGLWCEIRGSAKRLACRNQDSEYSPR